MKKGIKLLSAAIISIGLISNLFAEENYLPKQGTTGIKGEIGSSSSFIGGSYFLWENLAIHPEIQISFSKPEKKDNISIQIVKEEHKNYGGQITLSYYIPLDTNFAMYIGPSFGYSYKKDKYTSFSNFQDNQIYNNYNFSINFGLQCMLNKHFGVFLNTYLGFTKTRINIYTYDSDGIKLNDNEENQNNYFTGKASLGVVFYF